jgi:DNA polymerase zeta
VGARIARDVTALNPFPMKLKLEKVLMPAVLETKKRYVGMAFETRDDEHGTFDAKGIETV